MKHERIIKNVFFCFLFIFIFSSFVFAQPPFQSQSLDSTLTLETIQFPYHPIGQDYYLHTHVHSTTNGLLKNSSSSNLSCNYHLYAEHVGWNHLSVGNLSPYGVGMQTTINGSYFETPGSYAIMMWCQCEGCIEDNPEKIVGGFVRYFFSVTDITFQPYRTDFSMFSLILGIISLILFLTFMGYTISRPKPNLADDHPTNDNKRLIGTLFYFFSCFVFIVLSFVLLSMTQGLPYYTAIRSLFIVLVTVFGLILTVGTLMVFISLFANWMKDNGGKIYK